MRCLDVAPDVVSARTRSDGKAEALSIGGNDLLSLLLRLEDDDRLPLSDLRDLELLEERVRRPLRCADDEDTPVLRSLVVAANRSSDSSSSSVSLP